MSIRKRLEKKGLQRARKRQARDGKGWEGQLYGQKAERRRGSACECARVYPVYGVFCFVVFLDNYDKDGEGVL
jgi:hypothetical protein